MYQRIPSIAYVGESDRIELSSVVERITFETDFTNGFYGLINVTMNGEIQMYQCIDCLVNSPSTQLGLIYLDKGIMNGPQNVPDASNCQDTCTFIKSELQTG